MTLIAILPVKPLAEGKSRLAGVLGKAERTALNRRLFRHVLAIAAASVGSSRTLIVSRDPAVLDTARARHALALCEEGDGGLNAALDQARKEAVRRGATAVLVLPVDLPLLATPDVEAIVAAAGPSPAVVVAPDREEAGTNALLLSPPSALPFAFGLDSFPAYLVASRRAGIEPAIIRREALAADIDTADDHARLRDLVPG